MTVVPVGFGLHSSARALSPFSDLVHTIIPADDSVELDLLLLDVALLRVEVQAFLCTALH